MHSRIHHVIRFASRASYRIDLHGNTIGSTSTRYYEADDDTERYWILNSVNNTIQLTGFGPVSLNSAPFQVSDILDVTWSSDSAGYSWMIVNDGISQVPIPTAFWLFASGLLGMVGIARRRNAA